MHSQISSSLGFVFLVMLPCFSNIVYAKHERAANELPLTFFSYWTKVQLNDATERDVNEFMSLLSDDFVLTQHSLGSKRHLDTLTKNELHNKLLKRANGFTQYDAELITYYHGPDKTVVLYKVAPLKTVDTKGNSNPKKQVFVDILKINDGKIASLDRMIEVKN